MALIGFFSLLVGVDNIIDYGTNYAFVEHVMAMDTLFPDTTLTWRAITSDVAQQCGLRAHHRRRDHDRPVCAFRAR